MNRPVVRKTLSAHSKPLGIEKTMVESAADHLFEKEKRVNDIRTKRKMLTFFESKDFHVPMTNENNDPSNNPVEWPTEKK
jgi:hypothetical protein